MINEVVRKENWFAHLEERKLLAARWESPELLEFMGRNFKKSSKI